MFPSEEDDYIGNRDHEIIKPEKDMAIHLNRREELMKNATTIDMVAANQRMRERIEQKKAEEAEKKRLEDIRIDNMACPLCKSKYKKHINIRKDNGIIGPGYHSHTIIDFYVCSDCGIHYSDLNKK